MSPRDLAGSLPPPNGIALTVVDQQGLPGSVVKSFTPFLCVVSWPYAARRGAIDEQESFIDATFLVAKGYAGGRSSMRYSGSGLR